MKRSTLWAGMLALLAAPIGPPVAQAQGRVHTIVMRNMLFGPVPANLRAGDTIVWVNRDLVPHTATARDRSFEVILPAGHSARTTVRRPGTFPFYCRYHPAMRATLVASR